jgi:hypothetical protein
MGKIKGWKKNIDSRMEEQWVNKSRNHKVRITARANNFGGKSLLWSLHVFDNNGQYASKVYSNQIKYGSMTKCDALDSAMKYMRKYP